MAVAELFRKRQSGGPDGRLRRFPSLLGGPALRVLRPGPGFPPLPLSLAVIAETGSATSTTAWLTGAARMSRRAGMAAPARASTSRTKSTAW